jgi:hypothetical protein
MGFPSDTLDYCGEKIEGRKCPPDSLKDPKDHKIRINFGDIEIEGYDNDRGHLFSSKNNLEYGWSIDN